MHAPTSTYSNAPEHASAGAALRQVQLAFEHNVYYLDGGWKTLVDGLATAARAAGVRVQCDASVKSLACYEDAAGGVHGLPAEHEDIRVVVKTLAEIEAMLEAGAIESGHTLIGLYWLLRHRERLQRRWTAS